MERRLFIKNAAVAAGAMVVPTIVPSSVFGKNSPSNKINIGQIGYGRMGRGDMRNAMNNDVTRMIAVSDVDRKRMEGGKKFIEDFYNNKTGSNNAVDVKMYPDYKEMLLSKDIDAVIISTPDHWHAQPGIEAALAGKDMYLQKPNSLTVTEGRLLSDIVHRQGVIMQIGTQQRSMPQFRIAAELVRNGRIGKLHTVKIGLPGDPAGPDFPEMPVPRHLNFDMWMGCTPEVPYTENGVHPEEGYGTRPGWLRIEHYGAGMITGWGQHHYDSAAWGMDTEHTGPVSVEAVAEFPRSGLWDVHGDFMVKHEYENGINVFTSGGFPNGIRYIGTDGWIFVTRGVYRATSSDPIPEGAAEALTASDPEILEYEIGADEIQLYKSDDHYKNWIDCIQSRKDPISPVETGHRACSVCLISHIAMKIPGILKWDPGVERFIDNDLANSMLSRPQRYPYGTNYINL